MMSKGCQELPDQLRQGHSDDGLSDDVLSDIVFPMTDYPTMGCIRPWVASDDGSFPTTRLSEDGLSNDRSYPTTDSPMTGRFQRRTFRRPVASDRSNLRTSAEVRGSHWTFLLKKYDDTTKL